jgi:glycosyltransferase involved in cell wall biosynthesis
MYSGVPVIAPNSGGPMESVTDGKSGYLIDGTGDVAAKWAEKME